MRGELHMMQRFKNAIKGESGMPTTEAVALIAVALLMYAVFVLFRNQIQGFINGVAGVVQGWANNANPQ